MTNAASSPRPFWRGIQARYLNPFSAAVSALTIANLLSGALSFGQLLVTARVLGPHEYGIAALLMNFPDIVYGILDARSNEASTRYITMFCVRGENGTAAAICSLSYLVDLTISALAVAVTWLAARIFSEFILKQPEAPTVVMWYAFSFIPRAFANTGSATLLSLGRFKTVSSIEMLASLMRTATLTTWVLLKPEAESMVLATAASAAFSGLAYLVVSEHVVRRTWGFGGFLRNPAAARPVLRDFSRMLVFTDASSLLGVLPKQLDILLLGRVRPATEVGFYKMAKSVASVLGYVVKPLQAVAYPELARLVAQGRSVAGTARAYARDFGLPLLVVSVVFAAFMHPILHWTMRGKFDAATPAAMFAVVGAGVWSFFFWLKPAYLATGQAGLWLRVYAVAAVLTMLTFAAVVSPFGATGLAAAWTASQILLHGGGALLFAYHASPTTPDRLHV